MTAVQIIKAAVLKKEIEILENSIEELRLHESRDEIAIANLRKLVEQKRLALAENSADEVLVFPV